MEYTKENLLKATKIVNNNKHYSKEKDLQIKIQMFEMYKFAVNWMHKYNKNK